MHNWILLLYLSDVFSLEQQARSRTYESRYNVKLIITVQCFFNANFVIALIHELARGG